MGPGRFITFEGGEGAGKSTQARLLADRLRARGIDVVVTREPGGSPFAEQVRGLILDPAIAPHSVLAEALLFYAARADHLDKLIRPALQRGRWVISDRFSDSTRVYQSVAGGMPAGAFEALERLVVGATMPDLTIVLDLDPQTGLQRATERRLASVGADAFEKRDLAFHHRLRDGFMALVAAEPTRCAAIDGGGSVETIAAAVWGEVERRLLAGGG